METGFIPYGIVRQEIDALSQLETKREGETRTKLA